MAVSANTLSNITMQNVGAEYVNMPEANSLHAVPGGTNYNFPWNGSNAYVMGQYRGRKFFRANNSISGQPNAGGAYFPTTNLSMSMFIGTSPDDEWNCDCAPPQCQCGK